MEKIELTNNVSIGEGCRPVIVAEIGLNHNGNLDTALKMIQRAKNIGVDAVKFQVKDVEEAHPKEMLDMPYEGPNSFGKTYREHKQALEFSQNELEQIYDFAKKINIICFSTPCNVTAVKRLEQLNNPIYKIASFHLTFSDILEQVCKTGKPIIMSTGASSLEEIDKAVELIRSYHDNFALLHAVSCYPTENKDMNLKQIISLQERYNCPVGYSGHEKGVALCTSTIAIGACLIERHFTLDRTMKGPDHASSVEEDGFRLIVDRSQNLYEALGSDKIRVMDCELANRKKFRGY